MASKDKKLKQKVSETKKSFPWILALVPAVFAFLLYSNTLNHGYVLDDVSAITENLLVKQGTKAIASTEKNIWNTDYRYGYWNEPGSLYRPLALTLFAWEWEKWENNPAPAHLINVFMYALVCLLLFYWLFLLFGLAAPWLPFVITLIFAAHPIHTEVVANIKSADELMAMLFSLITLIAIWQNKERKVSVWIVAAIVSYFLALTSKESVVTLLPIFPLMFWFFSDLPMRKVVIPSLWLLLPLGFYFSLRADVLGAVTGKETFQMIDNIVAEVHGIDRFATAVKLSGIYLLKLFVPHPLSHDYSFNEIPIVGPGSPYFLISLLVYFILFWFAYRGFKTKQTWSFAILFFLLTFSLFSNIVFIIGTHLGERLLFLPSIGFAIAIGWLFWRWATLKSPTIQVSKAIMPIASLAILLALFSFKTIQRNGEWKSEFSLYEADVKNSPKSARTHYRLGMSYMKDKALKTDDKTEKNMWMRKALAELMRATEIYPEYADAQGELGLAYQRLGMRDQAVDHYKIALKLNSTHATTLNNMGTVLFEQGKFDRAISYFLKALERNPRYKDAAGNLASCYGTIGQYPDAIKWFRKAIELDPRNASYYYFLGITYQNTGDLVQAEAWLSKAYSIDPSLQPKR